MISLSSRSGDRGVTVVIGVLLMVSIVFLAAAQYQVVIVPQEEESSEIEHFSVVSTELDELRTGVSQVVSTGSPVSQQVTMGARYDQGTIFGVVPKIHPPDPAGSLVVEEFAGDSMVEFEFARGVGSSESYWTGRGECDAHCFESNVLRYDVGYNEFVDSPELVLENSVLYEKYDDSDGETEYVVRSSQSLVNGKQINIVSMTGDVGMTQVRQSSVEVRPVSTSDESISVEGSASENVSFRVPTELPVEEWREVLDDQLRYTGDPSEGYISSVQSVSGGEEMRVEMVAGNTYTLELSKVHIQSQNQQESVPVQLPQYIAWDGDDEFVVRENTNTPMRGEVRDKFNNPVAGVPVVATVTDSSGSCVGEFVNVESVSGCSYSNMPGRSVSDDSGEVSFVYNSGEVEGNLDVNVDMRIESATPRRESVESSVPPTAFFRTVGGVNENSIRSLDVNPSVMRGMVGAEIPFDFVMDNVGDDVVREDVSVEFRGDDVVGGETVVTSSGGVIGVSDSLRFRSSVRFDSSGLYEYVIGDEHVFEYWVVPRGVLVYPSILIDTDEASIGESQVIDFSEPVSGIEDERVLNQNTDIIPPSQEPSSGVVLNVDGMNEKGNGEVARVESGSDGLRVGFLYDSIQSESSVYSLNITYTSTDAVRLRLVSIDGSVIGSADGVESPYVLPESSTPRSITFELSSQEFDSIVESNTGELRVIASADGDVTARIDEMRLVGSDERVVPVDSSVSADGVSCPSVVSQASPVSVTASFENTGSDGIETPVELYQKERGDEWNSVKTTDMYIQPYDTSSVRLYHDDSNGGEMVYKVVLPNESVETDTCVVRVDQS